MSLDKKLNAEEIVVKAGMSRRPEYYSGRGAILADLNSDILEKIYQGIDKEYGNKASKSFVNMVKEIPVLSATAFLLNLYKLESNNWKWEKNLFGNENGVYVDGPTDNAKMISGLMTIIEVSCKRGRDDTLSIKYPFLTSHKVKPKEKINLEDCTISYSY